MVLLLSPLIETWVLYSVGSLFIFARVVCRWRLIGVENFKADDYLIILAWITYTVMTVAAHIVGGHGDLHALTVDQRQQLSLAPPEAAEPFVTGTVWFCVGVATYITFIWLLKINMLILYQRVVNGLWVEKFIIPTMGLVGLTYVAIMMILFLPCRPYDRMWIVFPDQGEFCKPQSFLNMVPPLVMNLITDLCIMAIPAPVILPVRTTVWRKIGLVFLFFAGFFIMTAAILRVVFVLVLGDGPTAAIWSCREDVVAIVVGQAILVRPVFSKKFWTHDFATPSEPLSLHKRSGLRRKDPFSVTAALASANSDPESRGGTGGAARGRLGSKASSVTGSLVISVSREVEVENAESPPGKNDARRDYLRATNNAQCWREDGVEELKAAESLLIKAYHYS
ncbi:hypothetical protein QBC47DRAFT_457169 [Echria macrotheca]|uniref:Rhodopsin domain-containing protein n=1 Tax=Echria macrotheca TaxID=438768 RepID=A0AAJ0F862_9PEZI|nr:hypothetical protein QBC47DRAFT_457169 [Echria macrotheca]